MASTDSERTAAPSLTGTSAPLLNDDCDPVAALSPEADAISLASSEEVATARVGRIATTGAMVSEGDEPIMAIDAAIDPPEDTARIAYLSPIPDALPPLKIIRSVVAPDAEDGLIWKAEQWSYDAVVIEPKRPEGNEPEPPPSGDPPMNETVSLDPSETGSPGSSDHSDREGNASITEESSEAHEEPAEASPTRLEEARDGSQWIVRLSQASDPTVDVARFWDVNIRRFEERFAEDLNGDGEITPRPADRVLDDGSQSDGIGLLLSGEGILSLTTPTDTLPLYSLGLQEGDQRGVGDGSENGYVAATSTDAGNYWLAYRYTTYLWDERSLNLDRVTSWMLQTINDDGQIDWGSTIWTDDIRRFEERFAQDLDGDGEISPRPAERVLDDGSQGDGIGLKLNGEGILTLTTANEELPLLHLGMQATAAEDGRSDGYVAAAASDDGGYLLAIRYSLQSWDDRGLNPAPLTSWSVQTVNSVGDIDWSRSAWDVEIRHFEERFGQDLDGDGTISPRPAERVLDDGSQSDGIGLKLSGEGRLSLTSAEGVIPLHQLGYQSSSSGSGYRAAAAAEGGGYWFARTYQEMTSSGDSLSLETATTWSVQRLGLEPDGQIVWKMESWNPEISIWEEIFEQDLDGDGLIEPQPADQVIDDGSQADAVGLRLDGVGLLHLTVADQVFSLDGLGFQDASTYEAYVAAAAAETDGSYWLAKSFRPWVWNETGEQEQSSTELSWSVLLVDQSGQQDWSASYNVSDISSWETVFGQDLDGDQQINPQDAKPERDNLMWEPYYYYRDGVPRKSDGPLLVADGSVTMPDDEYADMGAEGGVAPLEGSDSLLSPTPPSGRIPSPRLFRQLEDVELLSSQDGMEEVVEFTGLTMIGKNGDDSMLGSRENDRIIGARNKSSRFGQDLIRSGSGYDQIVLGGTIGSFYSAAGKEDYAHIQHFNLKQDQLVIHGPLDSYSVKTGITVDGHLGEGLFNGVGDLIALIETRGSAPFSLTSASVVSL